MKRIILSLFALVATGAATAQEEEYSRWSVTPKAGLTVATVVGDDAQENSSSMAWAAGLEASLRPGRLLSFDFGLFYTRDRIKEEGQINYPNGNQFNFTASHFRLVTERLDMPLLLGLHVMPGLTLKAGMQPSLLMSATSKYHFAGFYVEPPLNAIYTDADLANLPKIPVDRDEKAGIKSQMYDFDICIPIGASYEWHNIVFDARYHFGLLSIAKDGDKKQDVNRRYLLLTLGYRFNL